MPSHHYHHPTVRPINRVPSAHQRDDERRQEEPRPPRRGARGGPGERPRARPRKAD